MKVHNLNGTSDNKCSCGSWLQHYNNFVEIEATFCSNLSCCNVAKVGGHVQKYKSSDKGWYIVPLCESCNKKSSDSVIDIGGTELVPANKSLTCEK